MTSENPFIDEMFHLCRRLGDPIDKGTNGDNFIRASIAVVALHTISEYGENGTTKGLREARKRFNVIFEQLIKAGEKKLPRARGARDLQLDQKIRNCWDQMVAAGREPTNTTLTREYPELFRGMYGDAPRKRVDLAMKRRPVYKFIETDGDEEPQEPVFWRDGYNEGYRQGYAEGRDAGRQEAKALPGEHLFHYVIEN